MDEYLGGDGIAVVEWAERCPEAIPETYIRIDITATGEEQRQFEINGRHSSNQAAVED